MREILGKASQIGCPSKFERTRNHSQTAIYQSTHANDESPLSAWECSHLSHAVVSNGAHGAIPVTLVPSVPFLAPASVLQLPDKGLSFLQSKG